MPDNRNESTDESGNGSVLTKISFGLNDLLRIQQAHAPQAGIGEFVNNRATEKLGQVKIDECPENGTKCREQDDEDDVQFGIGLQGLVSGGRHNHFRREGNERTLDGHQQSHRPVIQIVAVPIRNPRVNGSVPRKSRRGKGKNKKQAEQMAAKEALLLMGAKL